MFVVAESSTYVSCNLNTYMEVHEEKQASLIIPVRFCMKLDLDIVL